MKIYCCQFDIAWENKQANFEKIRSLLSAGEIEPQSLVLLPEMFATGFSMNVAAIAEEEKSGTGEFLSQTARQLGVFLMGGIVTEGKHRRGRNEAVLFTPKGELAARYCKVQPFTLGGESQNYLAGEELIVVPWRGFSLAPFICYDLRFPELFRGAVRRGANLMTVVANWPISRIEHWVTLLRARAIENQAYVAGVNRCGTDPRFTYNGQSLIVNPAGEIMARAGDSECVISGEVDLKEVNAYRAQLPFLKDIRADYGTLSK